MTKRENFRTASRASSILSEMNEVTVLDVIFPLNSAIQQNNSGENSKSIQINHLTNQLEIYPNPASNQLIVQNANMNGRMDLINLQGAILKTIPSSVQLTRIDLQGFEAGTYFICFYHELSGKIFVSRFMKN